ncbi:hypothetical protein HRbin37_00414 [bacterium HR37]|jgi:DNA-binding transcriptional ArsR family regulator|nr:hypothetical protein HRbin37_00414 [bacterium HR37]
MAIRINISRYGRVVGTREEGKKVQRDIVHSIEKLPEGGTLIVNLRGVKVLSGSFADEAVVIPYQRLVSGEYGEKNMLIECSNREVLEDLEAKLERRKLAMLGLGKDSQWYVIGNLNKYLQETLEEIVKSKKVTAGELAQKLGISVTNCNNRLSKLYRLGLIKRERVNNVTGGILYFYRSII